MREHPRAGNRIDNSNRHKEVIGVTVLYSKQVYVRISESGGENEKLGLDNKGKETLGFEGIG